MIHAKFHDSAVLDYTAGSSSSGNQSLITTSHKRYICYYFKWYLFCVSPVRGNTGIMYKDLTLLWAAKWYRGITLILTTSVTTTIMMGWQHNCVTLNFDYIIVCLHAQTRCAYGSLFCFIQKTMTPTTFNTFQECECLLGPPPSLGNNMIAPNFKSFSTIRNTVDPILSKVRRSIVFSVCQLPNPNHFLPGIRHIVFFFINAAKVDSGHVRVGKVWSWHNDM